MFLKTIFSIKKTKNYFSFSFPETLFRNKKNRKTSPKELTCVLTSEILTLRRSNSCKNRVRQLPAYPGSSISFSFFLAGRNWISLLFMYLVKGWADRLSMSIGWVNWVKIIETAIILVSTCQLFYKETKDRSK